MSQQPADILNSLLRANNLGWMIDMFAPPAGAIPFLLDRLNGVATRYRALAGGEDSFTPETLESESAQNPHKIRAFLQALCSTSSPDMLVMVWRILQGLTIREVEMSYRERVKFELRVMLALPGDGQDRMELYRSDDINDAALLRHFGIITIDHKPIFDGFFPLRLKGDRK